MFSLISISKSGEIKNRIGSVILIRPIDYAESPCSTGKETVSRIIIIEVIRKQLSNDNRQLQTAYICFSPTRRVSLLITQCTSVRKSKSAIK